MALNLHQKCLDQLRTLLAEQLAHVEVMNGIFLSGGTTAYLYPVQNVLPTTGKIHSQLHKLIGEWPLIDFVNGTLARELYESQDYDSSTDLKPLRSIPVYSDLTALSDRLISEFESLPWRYTVTIPLPASFSEIFCSHIGAFTISDTVSIRRGGSEMLATYPVVSGIKKRDLALTGGQGLAAFAFGQAPEWKPDQAYLQIQVVGFIGKYTTTEPLLEAISFARVFIGLGLALRLFTREASYQQHRNREKAFIHRQFDNSWAIEDLHELDSKHSESMRNIRLHDLDGALNTPGKLASWMKQQLSSISVVVKGGERTQNMLLGAQWLFDSYSGNDELLQFIQATVVVEILLGDKASSDIVGLGELLSSRCAYLIATSHAERANLIEEFRTIYDVRSKIVHRGKSRLRLSERVLLDKLKWMCRRIIQEEIKLVEKDVGK